MTRMRNLLGFGLALVLIVFAMGFGQLETVRDFLRFDLRVIGESIYQARSQTGSWPDKIEDLEQTEYLKLPYRPAMLQKGQFIIVWHKDLDMDPAKNRNKILAYDNSTILARFGRIWVCRGDLRTESISSRELQKLLTAQEQ